MRMTGEGLNTVVSLVPAVSSTTPTPSTNPLASSPPSAWTPLRRRSKSQFDDDDDGSDGVLVSGGGETALSGGGVLHTLPIGVMVVDVFERYIMRVLTSLHRLVGKMVAADVDVGGTVSTMASWRPARPRSDATVRWLWKILRRITRRIERLRAMAPLLALKHASLVNRVGASSASGRTLAFNGGSGNTNGAGPSAALQSDIFLVEALMTKLETSVATFEEVEAAVLRQLVAEGR